jgi:hypothetical protein
MSTRFYRNPVGRGFAGGVPCQAPSEGDQPFASSPFAHPIPQGRRRASGDLFSDSLKDCTIKTIALCADEPKHRSSAPSRYAESYSRRTCAPVFHPRDLLFGG